MLLENALIYRIKQKDNNKTVFFGFSKLEFKICKRVFISRSKCDKQQPINKYIRENGGFDNFDFTEYKTFENIEKLDLYWKVNDLKRKHNLQN